MNLGALVHCVVLKPQGEKKLMLPIVPIGDPNRDSLDFLSGALARECSTPTERPMAFFYDSQAIPLHQETFLGWRCKPMIEFAPAVNHYRILHK